MVVEAASSEQTLSVSFVRPWHMSECPGLEYCWPPATEAVTVLGKIHIYLILRIKNAIWEIKRDTFFTNIWDRPSTAPAVHQILMQAPIGENTDCLQVWFTSPFWSARSTRFE